MEEKLLKLNFVRVHRSFLANFSKLDMVAEHHLINETKGHFTGQVVKRVIAGQNHTF